MARVETEARVLITTLKGEVHAGVVRNMNGEAIAVHTEANLEPGTRVTVSYYTDAPEGEVTVSAIVRRRNGFCYVFDTSLVDLMDQNSFTW